jgi:hypothetical protein
MLTISTERLLLFYIFKKLKIHFAGCCRCQGIANSFLHPILSRIVFNALKPIPTLTHFLCLNMLVFTNQLIHFYHMFHCCCSARMAWPWHVLPTPTTTYMPNSLPNYAYINCHVAINTLQIMVSLYGHTDCLIHTYITVTAHFHRLQQSSHMACNVETCRILVVMFNFHLRPLHLVCHITQARKKSEGTSFRLHCS